MLAFSDKVCYNTQAFRVSVDPSAYVTSPYHAKNVETNLWEVTDKYTVTFNSNGGTDVEPQTVVYNALATEPTEPTKTGYTFQNWLNGEAVWKFDTDIVTSDLTLVANWTVNKYTITINTDGGNTIAPIEVEYGAKITVPTPTKSG